MEVPYSIDHSKVAAVTQRWVDKWVVAHGLCPWASGVNNNDKLRITVCDNPSGTTVRNLLSAEITLLLNASSPTETTLIVLPALTDFDQFLDYVDRAEIILERYKWSKDIQLAHFHPGYCFQDAVPDDVSNYTNRSPYPILHLLKVSQVAEAIARVNGNTDFVWQNNMRRLRRMGKDNVCKTLEAIRTGDLAGADVS